MTWGLGPGAWGLGSGAWEMSNAPWSAAHPANDPALEVINDGFQLVAVFHFRLFVDDNLFCNTEQLVRTNPVMNDPGCHAP